MNTNESLNIATAFKKPDWLRKKISLEACAPLKAHLKKHALHTVCQEARCPNMGECFSRKKATFLVLGDTCTRNCGFCALKKGSPSALDYARIQVNKDTAASMGLRHIVVTSVTRDDLPDGGAEYFAELTRALQTIPGLTIELLIPDFNGDQKALMAVIRAEPHIIGHNIETVSRLYPRVRSKADFKRSLTVLSYIKEKNPSIYSKSGIMLGLGEKTDEILETLDALRSVFCDFLSIGQYLQPTLNQVPVERYVPPPEFDAYKKLALQKGFRAVASGPYVRSSYGADEYLSAKGL